MAWVLDLDGVVWLAGQAIGGSVDAVARLLTRGEDVVFVTNNSNPTIAEHEAALARIGIDASGRAIGSATALRELVEPGQRVLLCAGAGAGEAVAAAGAEVVDGGDADAVVVGLTRAFDYELLRAASTAIRRGARFLATNDDATYPTSDGPIPGSGAILAAVERATGQRATVAGKPYAPMVAVVRARCGDGGVVVGDRPDTDGRFARALGYRFALVLTGVTTAADAERGVDPAPDEIGPDLAALVAHT